MSAWVAVRQALMMVEAVEAAWGQELGLDRTELMATLLVARRPDRSTSDIAWLSGTRRQNVWRSLKALQKRGLVHPTNASMRGAEGWSLSEAGVELARRLEARLTAWETMLNESVDLEVVVFFLQRMVECVVNRPTGGKWRSGIIIPEEQRLDPEWDLHLQNAVRPEIEVPPLGTHSERAERKAAQTSAELRELWNALWNR
jgi:DNA-binding MarR family transcriptional regulator